MRGVVVVVVVDRGSEDAGGVEDEDDAGAGAVAEGGAGAGIVAAVVVGVAVSGESVGAEAAAGVLDRRVASGLGDDTPWEPVRR